MNFLGALVVVIGLFCLGLAGGSAVSAGCANLHIPPMKKRHGVVGELAHAPDSWE